MKSSLLFFIHLFVPDARVFLQVAQEISTSAEEPAELHNASDSSPDNALDASHPPDSTSEVQHGGGEETAEAGGERGEQSEGQLQPSVESSDAAGGEHGGGAEGAAVEGEGEGGITESGEDTMAENGSLVLKAVEESAVLSSVEAAGPPPAAAYVPPEVGDDYIPVADLPPLPLPYGLNELGKKVPLTGIESLFLTGEGMPMCHVCMYFFRNPCLGACVLNDHDGHSKSYNGTTTSLNILVTFP